MWSINRFGTLTIDEREIINHHIGLTIRMLEELRWPEHLRSVPEYVGGHHERMDGKGLPAWPEARVDVGTGAPDGDYRYF
jgi:HD-GYP domain-containing protein (c-di-GMP phosphodiesterase class II)